jgi:hypothetical protein
LQKTELNRRNIIKKRAVILLLVCFFIPALSVQAARVIFVPQTVEMKLAPGETGRTALTAHGFAPGAYSLSFLVGSRLENSTIPSGWLTAAYLWLDTESPGRKTSRSMDLVITVPADARPGRYSGLVVPNVMQCSEPISSPGIAVVIEVLGS